MPTKLEAFLKSRRITPGDLVKASGKSRQYLLKVRAGHLEPTRPAIEAIVKACRALSGEKIRAGLLFDIGDSDDD